MHTGCTMSAAWPGWTSTRWSRPPMMPLSRSGQSPTEEPHPRLWMDRIRD
nr:alternative protein WDR1 [Homo sapiens]